MGNKRVFRKICSCSKFGNNFLLLNFFLTPGPESIFFIFIFNQKKIFMILARVQTLLFWTNSELAPQTKILLEGAKVKGFGDLDIAMIWYFEIQNKIWYFSFRNIELGFNIKGRNGTVKLLFIYFRSKITYTFSNYLSLSKMSYFLK